MRQRGQRETGIVKKIVREKGFGFIAAASGSEFFFHRSSCPDFDRLNEGDVVSFLEGESSHRGQRAEHVEVTR